MRRRAEYKWKFAIGTTSRVPNSRLHYLIADFDKKWVQLHRIIPLNPSHIFIQRTPNGWHLYTDVQYTFKKLIELLRIIGADPKWISIGQSRGYLFLADKGPIYLPWPVERMTIYNGKKKGKEINTSRT